MSACEVFERDDAASLVCGRLKSVPKGATVTVILEAPPSDASLELLLSMPAVTSIVLPAMNGCAAAKHKGRIGWFDIAAANFALPSKVGSDVVYLGADWMFGCRTAYKTWRAGVKRIHTHTYFTGWCCYSAFGLALKEIAAAARYRLGRTKVAPMLEWLVNARLAGELSDFAKAVSGSFRPEPGRILLVGGSLGPGGTERQIVNTLLGLRTQGVKDIALLHEAPMVSPNDFFLPQLQTAGIDCDQLPRAIAPSRLDQKTGLELTALAKLLKSAGVPANRILSYLVEFRARRPEVVHTWLDEVNVMAGIAAMLTGVPRIVISCRSVAPGHFAFYQTYLKPLYRILCAQPNVVMLNNSQAGADSYAEWLGISSMKIRVVHNGFDFSALEAPNTRDAEDLRSGLQIPAHTKLVGTVMRLSEEKRPDLWLRAAALVAKADPSVFFLVVGDGPLRRDLELLSAELGLKERVRFTGKRQNVAELMIVMDAFLLTSRAEGLPNVLIEAQALGIPVVAAKVGGVPEVFEDGVTGLLVADATPDTLCEAILQVLSDQKFRAQCRSIAPVAIRERFSEKRMVAATMAIYERHASV